MSPDEFDTVLEVLGIELLDLRFLRAMNAQLAGGNLKPGRVAHDWRNLPPTSIERYEAKLARHASYRGGLDDTGQTHRAAVACNAMILHHLDRKSAEHLARFADRNIDA